MASFYEDASLVVIPSGYKTSKIYAEKPTDGSGDLTFTRASSATRVASNGLIEKVRENLCLQSNTFNTTWTTTSASVTSGQAGYDGTNNAWLLTKSGSSGRINQSFSLGALNTFSVYAKANASSYIAIEFGASFIYVNLTNGAQGSIGSGSYKIESIGSGWYRIIMTSSVTSGVFRIYPAENNDISATTGSIFIQNAQVETGDIATAYIPTTTAAVSVGPVSNVPRLDYLGSSCPRLLLEPQRTNLVQYSEQFNNAYWTLSNTTITANTTVSPDGTQNADTAVITAGGYIYAEFVSYAAVTGQSVTISVFAKSASGELVFFGGATTAGTDVYKIENYGNGWYRHSRVRTFTATATTTLQYLIFTNGTYILWGAQVEGSNSPYATSYIPTLGASVTRVADAASKTGISSLIGQTEGTIFAEINFDLGVIASGSSRMQLSDGTTSNWIFIGLPDGLTGNLIRIYATSASGTMSAYGANPIVSGINKIAFGYKSGSFVLYVNGAQAATSSTTLTMPTCSRIDLQGQLPNEAAFERINYNQALLFKTRLTNAQLAELTTL
jgi:hypothetical protein